MVPSQRVSAAPVSSDTFSHFSPWTTTGVYADSGNFSVSESLNMYNVFGGSIGVPSGCNYCLFIFYVSPELHIDPVNSSVSITPYAVVYDSASFVSPSGYSSASYANGQFMCTCLMEVPDSLGLHTSNFSLTMNISGYVSGRAHIYSVCTPVSGVVQYYTSLSEAVSRLDILQQTNSINSQIATQTQQQTDTMTNGFDNSQGNAAADQLDSEINNYIQQEDALYDQMQYEVPEVDIASDGQAIMLASNFLQSIYVSDSFISKCVTFVLTFGLIMYIIGWLKKKSG